MKLKKVTKNTNIQEIVEQVPDAVRILIEDYGIFCAGCGMARAETLAQGAQSHGLSGKELDKLVAKLNAKLK